MAKTNAQRQAEYRARHLKDEAGQAERLNMLVSITAKRRLERLAARYGVTQRALLERVLSDEERRALDGLSSDEQEAYYSLRRNDTKAQDKPSIASPATHEDQSDALNQDTPASATLLRNKSGFPGVSFHKASGKWQAIFKRKHLGLFATPEDASTAYKARTGRD